MPKFLNVDVLACLKQILKKNTVFFETDFEYDKKSIAEWAASNDPKDKIFIWMSRFHGTWCYRERDVFIKDSSAHNTILYYEDVEREEGILVYAVELTGIENGIIKGNIYPLDYPKYCKRVKDDSLEPYDSTYFFEHGKVEKEGLGIDRSFIEQHKDLGEFKYFIENPKNEGALFLLLKKEASSRCAYKEKDFNKYVAGLKQKIRD